MKIRTIRIPVRMGNYTYRLHDFKIKCRFGIRLFIYFILLIFVGPYFGNWTTTEKYLCRIDVYASECSLSDRMVPATDSFRCPAQRFMIAKLGSIIRSSVLTIGFVMGLLLDILGPKVTFLIGIIMRIVTWLIFSVKHASNSAIVFSSVLLGLSRNAIAYPTLTIYMYTTNFKEYATTVMGIGITLAGLYIMVIERLLGFTGADPHRFTLYSVLTTHIPCLFIGLILFPWKSPTPKVKHKATKSIEHIDDQISTDDLVSTDGKNTPSSDLTLKTFSQSSVRDSKISDFSSMDTGLSAYSKDGIDKGYKDNTMIRIERSGSESSDVDLDAHVQTEISMDDSQWNLKKFVKYLKSLEYSVTCSYFVLNFLDFYFMQMMFSTMYGEYNDVMVLNEYLVSFSFILTFFIGLLYKVFNPLTILIFSNMFGIISHFIAFSGTRVAGYFTASTLIAYASILFTQIYIYIQSTFDSKYFGSLVGTVNTFSGISMFFNIALISLVEKFSCINYIHIAMIIARSIFEVALIFLNFNRKKRTKSI
ncbi:Major Facilitator Superfamily protein [Theileria parva strain Muguga]|uniref:Major facilitator superfamily (MFS) profile domain-containing protein n=1 Tax=Theileria parva TaxID=5875 RepID=Q4N4G7_THEPA|nr:Major Facilitator Superfamily protein [Theileria parva strain Muguga]EAN32956.1 Major Facilitator Superfamily protein [Theileria parva strain Muguga]|eukprot:XP_765239.1 hypothetical protein [Theileria parva strain Muguga]